MVAACRTIPMLVDSDHEAVRLDLNVLRGQPARKTVRQQVARRDIVGTFGKGTNGAKKDKAITAILESYKRHGTTEKDAYTRMKTAVEEVVGNLPPKEKTTAGWCDQNDDELREAVERRNRRGRDHARKQTTHFNMLYRKARKQAQKVRQKVLNDHLLQEVKASNASLLPGGKDRRTGPGTSGPSSENVNGARRSGGTGTSKISKTPMARSGHARQTTPRTSRSTTTTYTPTPEGREGEATPNSGMTRCRRSPTTGNGGHPRSMK